jgi:hypothetical protein
MIKQGSADEVRMVKQEIAFTTDLQMHDIAMSTGGARQIAKRITVQCGVSEKCVPRT